MHKSNSSPTTYSRPFRSHWAKNSNHCSNCLIRLTALCASLLLSCSDNFLSSSIVHLLSSSALSSCDRFALPCRWASLIAGLKAAVTSSKLLGWHSTAEIQPVWVERNCEMSEGLTSRVDSLSSKPMRSHGCLVKGFVEVRGGSIGDSVLNFPEADREVRNLCARYFRRWGSGVRV